MENVRLLQGGWEVIATNRIPLLVRFPIHGAKNMWLSHHVKCSRMIFVNVQIRDKPKRMTDGLRIMTATDSFKNHHFEQF